MMTNSAYRSPICIFKRQVFLLVVLLAPFALGAQTKPAMQDHLDTIFQAGLRDYNRRAGNPMTMSEAQARAGIFYRAIKSFSGDRPGDYSQLKAGFEVAMVASNNGTPMVYNKDAVSVYDALCEGKANCAAGTNLYLGGAIQAWGEQEVQDRHLAVIFSKGHVQAGHFQKNEKGGWDLQRVETTATAVSPQSLGKTENLTKHGPLRVLLVDDYLKMEANRHSGLPNSKIMNEMLPEALDRVARYGVPINELEALIRKVPSSGSGSESVNSTPLSFGDAQVPEGDQQRAPNPGQVNNEWWPQSAAENSSKEAGVNNTSVMRPMNETDMTVGNYLHVFREKYGPLEPRIKTDGSSSLNPRHSSSILASDKEYIIRNNPHWVQDAIRASLDHRSRVMNHPWVRRALAQFPGLRKRINLFYDRELELWVAKRAAPYDGTVSLYEPEIYNFQRRLGRKFIGEVVDGKPLNNHSADSYLGNIYPSGPSGTSGTSGTNQNYDFDNEAQFILDLVQNPENYQQYLEILEGRGSNQQEPKNPTPGQAWELKISNKPHQKKSLRE